MRKLFISTVVGALMLTGTCAFAETPVVNISARIHPNLAAAQKLNVQAYRKIIAAQKVNKGHMDGHAEAAKDLIVQANEELKLAAESLNDYNNNR